MLQLFSILQNKPNKSLLVLVHLLLFFVSVIKWITELYWGKVLDLN